MEWNFLNIFHDSYAFLEAIELNRKQAIAFDLLLSESGILHGRWDRVDAASAIMQVLYWTISQRRSWAAKQRYQSTQEKTRYWCRVKFPSSNFPMRSSAWWWPDVKRKTNMADREKLMFILLMMRQLNCDQCSLRSYVDKTEEGKKRQETTLYFTVLLYLETHSDT